MSRPVEPTQDKPPKDRPADKVRDAIRFRVNKQRKRVDGVPVTNEYFEGFPTDAPYKPSVLLAEEHARDQGIEGDLLSHEKIETQDHIDAGEFMIHLQFGTEDPEDPENPTDPGPKG